MKKEIIINQEPKEFPYKWVSIYDPDQEGQPEIAQFDCFYAATDFMNKNGYSIVYLDDDKQNGGQYWGVRKWT